MGQSLTINRLDNNTGAPPSAQVFHTVTQGLPASNSTSLERQW